ncbi:hypothetical protein FK521_27900, partial [Klebsiella pneumoniae]|nr:hypothetical protein [Klebsiella pneumoniae]
MVTNWLEPNALAALFLTGAFSVWAADTPVKGGTLIYLEQFLPAGRTGMDGPPAGLGPGGYLASG